MDGVEAKGVRNGFIALLFLQCFFQAKSGEGAVSLTRPVIQAVGSLAATICSLCTECIHFTFAENSETLWSDILRNMEACPLQLHKVIRFILACTLFNHGGR